MRLVFSSSSKAQLEAAPNESTPTKPTGLEQRPFAAFSSASKSISISKFQNKMSHVPKMPKAPVSRRECTRTSISVPRGNHTKSLNAPARRTDRQAYSQQSFQTSQQLRQEPSLGLNWLPQIGVSSDPASHLTFPGLHSRHGTGAGSPWGGLPLPCCYSSRRRWPPHTAHV